MTAGTNVENCHDIGQERTRQRLEAGYLISCVDISFLAIDPCIQFALTQIRFADRAPLIKANAFLMSDRIERARCDLMANRKPRNTSPFSGFRDSIRLV